MAALSLDALQREGNSEVKKHLLLLATLTCACAGAHAVTLPPGVIEPPFFAKQGIKVLAYQKGAGGLNVWKVQRDGTLTVLYTTPDNMVLLSGVLWNAASGANLSDTYITPEMTVAPQDKAGMASLPAPVAMQASQAAKQLYSSTKPSEAIKGIATLSGIKEGKAAIDKTLYIIFDPRCPYCHAVYAKTRAYVKNGGTIKWIPTTILGDRFNGSRMVADIMQSPHPARVLADVMTKTMSSGSTSPDADTQKAINENEAYFFAAFQKNKGAGQPGVPVAFFETRDGAPQMVSGISDDALLNHILSDIKK